jgi:GIY-YIG catalytic domain-containing protein
MSGLRKADIPASAGVYALYRRGEPMYVGKATSLQTRVWKNHGGRGRGMGTSAMRRNVAERLGIAAANEIKDGAYRPTADDAARVRRWLDGCEIAWRESESEPSAKVLEGEMKAEYLPPLTKA